MKRWAFDIGANSIGWAIYETHARDTEGPALKALVASGARIYSDGRNPQDGKSLAVMRRVPRSARRRRDRFIQRRTWLMDLLVRHGLMPTEEGERKALEALDPYVLRAKALDHALTPHELGRVIFHLNQRRGFKSNRIVDGQSEDEDRGKIAEGVKRLREKLREQGCRTLGEFYARRQTGPVREREAVRVRLNGVGAKALYAFYPERDLLAEEFDSVWESQSALGAAPGEEARNAIRNALLFQRPLKPPRVGKCTFVPSEERLPSADPRVQALRIYQELNHLKLDYGRGDVRTLDRDKRDVLAQHLLSGEDLTFTVLRKIIALPSSVKVNLEEAKRDRLKGDETAARFGGKKGALKRIWGNLLTERRAAIVERAMSESEPEAFKAWLIEHIQTTPEEAEKASSARLPDGYGRLGPTAASRILAELKAAVVVYSEACLRAGYHHSDERDGEIFDELPYYGKILERHVAFGSGDPADSDEKRYGRISNPTVHIGLNQLRKLVNALIKAYGPPDEIVLELARELKLSQEDKERAEKENTVNKKKNEERAALIEKEGFVVNAQNLRLMRLWEELSPDPINRRCPYTGEPISISRLLSGEVEEEHILPFSRTLDDSMANKTVAMRGANREKRNQSPYEAWGESDPARYQEILSRADAFPKNKRWRFAKDAMEKYENEERDFLARQLNETKYLSRIAKAYLSKVCDPDQVRVTTGQLTALLRRHWGLNSILRGHNRAGADGEDDKKARKVRDDHRHHAIDAIVIGAIDRGLLNEMARRAGQHERDQLDRIVADVPIPFEGFRDAVADVVSKIVVSHKKEHGGGKWPTQTSGRLHEDTAYGIVEGPDKAIGNLVRRKPLADLTPGEIDGVRDVRLREALQAIAKEHGGDKKKLSAALLAYGEENKIRRVRILKKEKDFIAIKSRKTDAPYKAVIPGENHHIDIVEGPDGVWRGFAVSVFEANQKHRTPCWKTELPSAKLIMRVHKGDMIELDDPGGVRKIKKIVQLKIKAGQLFLVEHFEGGVLQKRHDDPEDTFRWDMASISRLKARNARLVSVDETGRVRR